MKKLTAFSGFLLLFASLYSQSGWMWQNPDPQGNELNGVSMSGTHWAVGAGGTVIHKVHPGDYWEIIDIGTTENLNDIYIFSISEKGWIVGDNGTIFYTNDNGVTWVQQNSGTSENLHSVSAVNDACVWACGDNGTVLKSFYNDGTWEKINSPYKLDLYSIDSYHCNEAWAVGEDGIIISTENGGQSWSSHQSGTSWDLFSVSMSESATSRACGYSGIIISKDWDEGNWHKENESLAYRLNSIVTTVGQTGYAVGSEGMILKGTDGGNTWVKKESGIPWNLNNITSIALEDYTYQIVGQYGIMLKNNGFDSEFEITNDLFWHWIQAIEFVNKDTGWAVGGDPGWGGTTDGVILNTTDGGETWLVQKNLQTPLIDMDFVNKDEGWAVGRDGLILHTANGGAGWGTQTSPVNGTLTSVCFTDEKNGWIVSMSNFGEIIHTANGGITWTKQTNPSGNPLHDVFFIDENKGWAVGLDSSVIRTTDGGAHWEWYSVNASQGYRFASGFFTDEMHGWIAGIHGSILRTVDGGTTWQEVESGTGEILNDIYFTDKNNGWAVGNVGTILHSRDGGVTWHKQVSHVASNFLTSVCFIDTSRGWVAGEGGSILYTIHGGSSLVNTIHADVHNNSGTEDGSAEHPYNTVAEAIDAATAGDSVIIHPGEYDESSLLYLDIKDGLIIVGEDSASTIIPVPFYTGELTLKYYTEISGLTCPGYSFASSDGRATIKIKGCHFGDMTITAANGYRFILEDCTIGGTVSNTASENFMTVRNNHFLHRGINVSGISAERPGTLIMEGNSIDWQETHPGKNSRKDFSTLSVSGNSDAKSLGAAIETDFSSAVIRSNTINVQGEGMGIMVLGGPHANITENIINLPVVHTPGQTTGIKTTADSGIVKDNEIHGGYFGLYGNSMATLFDGNNIDKAHTGFYCEDAGKIQNNVIMNCLGNGLVTQGFQGTMENNAITDNDSAGIVVFSLVDLGGGEKNSEGRNILQNNGYFDLVVKYKPGNPDTLHARYNLWDHEILDEILANDLLNEGGENLVVCLEGFLTLPDIPLLISPETDASIDSLNIKLSWGQTSIPDRYHLQVASDENFANPIVDTTNLRDTTLLITFNQNTMYYWRVQAVNPVGESEWSAIRHFTTGTTGFNHLQKSDFDFQISPNPVRDNISIRFSGFMNRGGKIEFYTIAGKKVTEKQIPAGNKIVELNVYDLPGGFYFCKVSWDNQSVTRKVIIHK